MFKHFLVNQYAQHIRIVVYRKYIFSHWDKNPETLFFVQIFEQIPDYKIHTLTVPNRGISFHESWEYIS